VEYLFTDKTGTLTENTMWFRRCSVAGITYLEDGGRMFQLPADGDERNGILIDTFTVSKPHIYANIVMQDFVDSSYSCSVA
jgi:phospholipid-translocating ATPase